MRRPGHILDLEGPDPLDAVVVPAPALALSPLDVLLRRRAALGLPAVTPPAVLFIPLGYLLGPQALGVLPTPALEYLDVAVVVALATLGSLVGMSLELRHRDDARALRAAVLEAVSTAIVVTGAMAWLLARWQLPLDLSPLVAALTLGLAASASSAGTPEAGTDAQHDAASRIATLDDVVPIVGTGAMLVLLRATSMTEVLGLSALTVGLGAILAAAGWLLFEPLGDTAERSVYVIGILVAIGGATAYLRLSPLAAGVAAGLVWSLSPGIADRIVRRHVSKIQHALVVVLLVVAGARMVLDASALWLLVACVLLRVAGKVLGGWLATRLVPHVGPADLGAYLLAPGLIGIASALVVGQAVGSAAGTAVVTAAAAATVVSELVALVVIPGGARS
ncbi:MAG: hypothetical protein U0Q12_20165 [Vicinamibacterales bacterium]